MPTDSSSSCPSCGKFSPEVATLGLCSTCLLEAGKRPASGETNHSEIGSYTLHGRLGEGGFGTVYLAEQSEPFEREVALKILKAGAASTEVARRFEAERQTLARLDHPNIASFFDSGETPDGRPYFVMELVEGSSVTEYCDQKKLSLNARLTLFLDICSALQHAHQKGVIHRDLKPQNILVTEIDGRPVPKVIDFGVAKILEPITAGAPGTTLVSSILGTPAYMSPEQAAGRQEDVDTRTDVYALGVLLYELLSGQLPFDSERLLSATHAELETILRDEEPSPPSTRAAETAALRGSTSTRIGSKIRGDLDWIVARAMSKTVERRYAGANAFAEDIRRHLAGETVDAGPPDLRYRAGKFVRKHRAPMISALLILAAIIAGATISILQAIRATHAESLAKDEAARANAATQFLLEDILGQADPQNNTNRELTLKDAIDRGADLIDTRFKERPKVASFLHNTLSSAYLNLGESESAIRESKRAVELTRPTKDTDIKSYFQALFGLAAIYLVEGDLPQARTLFENEIAPFTSSPVASMRSDALQIQGKLLLEEKRFAPAETALRAALDAALLDSSRASILGILGYTLNSTGRHKEAIELGEEALALIRKNNTPDSITLIRAEQSLARTFGNAGLYDEAIKRHEDITRRAIATLGPDHPDVEGLKVSHAYVLDDAGEFPQAEALLREVLEPAEASGTYSSQQLIALDNLAFLLSARGDYEAATAYNFTSIREKKKRFGENAVQVLATEFNHAIDLRRAGDLENAERELRRIYDTYAKTTSRSSQQSLHTAKNVAITLDMQDRQPEIVDFLIPALTGLGTLSGKAATSFSECESYLFAALRATGDTARLREYYFDRLWQDPSDPSPWFAADTSPTATAVGFAALGKSRGRIPREALSRLESPIVPPGAEWRYYDSPDAPPENWNSPTFDASTWKSGPSELGYGDGDEATVISFGDDPSNKPITSYYLNRFQAVGNQPLTLLLSCDDGAVAYLDGEEIARIHLPEIEITPTTGATVSVGQALESDFAVIPIPQELLTLGSHTLSIEIHQDRPSSSDVTCLPVLVPSPPIPQETYVGKLPPQLAALLEIHRLIALGKNQLAHQNLKKLIADYPDHNPIIIFDELLGKDTD